MDHPVLLAALDPAYQGEDHANHIRKMQSSFSWDSGPAFPTVGLWFVPVSSLYLISIRTLAVVYPLKGTKHDIDKYISSVNLCVAVPLVCVAHDL
jgi:hypothetical protein